MNRLKTFFFGPTFLTGRRLDDYPRLIVLVLLFAPPIVRFIWQHAAGSPGLISDFSPMYAGGMLARQGNAIAAYDYGPLNAMISAVLPAYEGGYVWLFPPTFFFPTEFLAHLPHDAAYFLWMIATGALAIVCLRPLVASRRQAWLLATFPAVLVNFWVGQNGFLVAALLAAVAVWASRRPVVASLALAALTFKPHFGLLFPPLLLVERRFRVFVLTSLFVLALIGLSVAAYGTDVWLAFLDSTPGALGDFTVGVFPIERHTSIFAGLVRLGLARDVAMPVQIAVALVVLVAVLLAARRSPDWPLMVSLAIAATFLATPYVFPYDWAALLVPLAMLSSRAVEGGWRIGERATLAALWLGAALSGFFPQPVFGTIAVLPLIALFVVLLARCLRPASAG